MAVKDDFNKTYRGDIIGREVIVLESAVSTNDCALEIGRDREDSEGIVVIADKQTGGRGRFDRKWISPPGVNLYFSVILKPDFVSGDVQLVTLAAAAAVASTVRDNAGLNAEIKWPNDIMLNNRKVCGILVEMRSGGNRPSLLIVGIGLNVNMHKDAFDDDLKKSATSLKIEKGHPLDRGSLFNGIVSRLEVLYNILLTGDKKAVIQEWYRLNCTLGKGVSIRVNDRIITGMADGINKRGELLVRLSTGEIETVSAGDVTLLNE